MCLHLLKTLSCRYCGFTFYLCRSCWRGQAYCCEICRITARKLARRKSQRRYRQTQKGKKRHCEGERRRRIRRTLKSVDDQSSTPAPTCATSLDRPLPLLSRPAPSSVAQPCCQICGKTGRAVTNFPPRPYGQKRWRDGNLQC